MAVVAAVFIKSFSPEKQSVFNGFPVKGFVSAQIPDIFAEALQHDPAGRLGIGHKRADRGEFFAIRTCNPPIIFFSRMKIQKYRRNADLFTFAKKRFIFFEILSINKTNGVNLVLSIIPPNNYRSVVDYSTF